MESGQFSTVPASYRGGAGSGYGEGLPKALADVA
jgi:hypothetical protein